MFSRKCYLCDKEDVYVWNGRRTGAKKTNPSGGRVYVNAEGLLWSGRKCPYCALKRLRTAKPSFLQSPPPGNDEGPNLSVKMTKRRCRKCRKFLGEDRYFAHVGCNQIKSYEDWSHSYEVYSTRGTLSMGDKINGRF